MGDNFWNHRVIYHTEDGPGREYYAVHECHYQSGSRVPHSWTENPVIVLENSVKDIETFARRILVACKQPILTEQDGILVEFQTKPTETVTGKP